MAWVDKAKETSAEHAAEREQAVKRGRGANGPITEAKRETPMSSRPQPPVQAHVSQFSRINGAPSHKSQAWRAHRAPQILLLLFLMETTSLLGEKGGLY